MLLSVSMVLACGERSLSLDTYFVCQRGLVQNNFGVYKGQIVISIQVDGNI